MLLFDGLSTRAERPYDEGMMPNLLKIQFHGKLNDFLSGDRKGTYIEHPVQKRRSVKDLIESLGVPHTEVDIIVVNHQSVSFDFILFGGAVLEVYPSGKTPPLEALIHNAVPIPEPPRFVLDVHLGKLASYMRMLGFDTWYRNDYDDPELAAISSQQQRILITCDKRLLMRKKIILGYFMRSRKPKQQIKELLTHFNLFNYQPTHAFCISCNGIIHAVNKESIQEKLLPLTREHYQTFYQCSDCKKIYWEGSHHTQMQQLIERIKAP